MSSFGDEDKDSTGKAFVRGGVIQPGAPSQSGKSISAMPLRLYAC